jgi:hypothetical protein
MNVLSSDREIAAAQLWPYFMPCLSNQLRKRRRILTILSPLQGAFAQIISQKCGKGNIFMNQVIHRPTRKSPISLRIHTLPCQTFHGAPTTLRIPIWIGFVPMDPASIPWQSALRHFLTCPSLSFPRSFKPFFFTSKCPQNHGRAVYSLERIATFECIFWKRNCCCALRGTIGRRNRAINLSRCTRAEEILDRRELSSGR